MEYIRKQFYTLKERLLEPRKFMQVLAGPRQVGKSTLVDQVLAQVSIPHTIDVWIRRALKENFPPDFDPDTLGDYAGLAQQYIFYYARSLGREK